MTLLLVSSITFKVGNEVKKKLSLMADEAHKFEKDQSEWLKHDLASGV